MLYIQCTYCPPELTVLVYVCMYMQATPHTSSAERLSRLVTIPEHAFLLLPPPPPPLAPKRAYLASCTSNSNPLPPTRDKWEGGGAILSY